MTYGIYTYIQYTCGILPWVTYPTEQKREMEEIEHNFDYYYCVYLCVGNDY